jgi:hypothetical protein
MYHNKHALISLSYHNKHLVDILLMRFSIYLYKTTLSSPRAAKARKAAHNAVSQSLSEQREAIERVFGDQDWVAVM